MNKFKALAAAPLVAASALTLLMSGTASAAGATLTGSPTTGLKAGSTVTVSGTGFAASTTIYIVLCSKPDPAQSNCDITHLAMAQSSATGTIPATPVAIRTGAVGDGTCTATATNCSIEASDAGGGPKANLALTFGGGAAAASPTAAATSAATTSAAATSAATTTSTTSTTAPTAVAAGTGGHAGDNGLPMGITILAIAGVAVVGAGTVRLARR